MVSLGHNELIQHFWFIPWISFKTGCWLSAVHRKFAVCYTIIFVAKQHKNAAVHIFLHCRILGLVWILFAWILHWTVASTRWWCHQMETFFMLLAHTSDGWIPLTKASDAELWCFIWSAPGQAVEQTIEMLLIWDASRSLWYHFNECYWYGALTHCPLGNVAIILNVWFWNIFQWLVSMYFQCHIVMTSQYWFRSWLGAVMQQAVTWASVKPIWHHMSSLGLNYLMGLTYQKTWSPMVLVLACWLICCEPLANTLTNAFISSLRSLGMQPNGQMVWLLSHPGIPGVTLCFCTGSYAAACAAAGHRFLFTQ